MDKEPKDQLAYVEPPKEPMGRWAMALWQALIGTGIGLVFTRLLHMGTGSKAPISGMEVTNAAISWGGLFGLTGYYQGEGNEREHAAKVENAKLKNIIIDMKSKENHADKIQHDGSPPARG